MSVRRQKRLRSSFAAMVLIVAGGIFSACAHMPPTQGGADASRGESEVSQDEYILGVDDVIKVTVENHPEWSGDFTIDPSGNMTIPSLGEFFADGKNREALIKDITARVGKYINRPVVNIHITKYVSEVIYVLGAVNKPGKYTTDGKRQTLRDVVINAGLPAKYAATNRVFIISPSKKHPKRQVVNLYRVLYQGDIERNIEVKPGEIVYVPENFLGLLSDFLGALLTPFNSVSTAGLTGVK